MLAGTMQIATLRGRSLGTCSRAPFSAQHRTRKAAGHRAAPWPARAYAALDLEDSVSGSDGEWEGLETQRRGRALDFDRGTHQHYDAPEADVELTLEVTYDSRPGEEIKAVGNLGVLGEWDLERAVALEWREGNVWHSPPLPVAPGCEVQYKYVLCSGGDVVWSSGKNLFLHVPSTAYACRLGVQDSWDQGLHEQHTDVGHALPQPIPRQCFECGQCLMPHLWCSQCPKFKQLSEGGGGASDGQLPLPTF